MTIQLRCPLGVTLLATLSLLIGCNASNPSTLLPHVKILMKCDSLRHENHHSNVRLPIGVERSLNILIVTPRMHSIHHSIIRDETDSNWSSGLTLWDWVHGTLRLNVPQKEITIGVPAYRASGETSLLKMLTVPFIKQRPSWPLFGGGRPARLGSSMTRNRLAA